MKSYLTFWNLLGLFLLIFGLWLYFYASKSPQTEILNYKVIEEEPLKSEKTEIRLYFAKKNANGFIIEKRIVTLKPGESKYQRALVELIKGPTQSGEPILPKGSKTPTVFVSGRSAYVDLPREYAQLGYGTTGETLLIYGIANTVLDQGPLDEVWFLIGGEPARTLGHLSLVEPIRRSR